ncbi:MAG: DUF2914 domain-containing protein [Thiocapsa sp.]|jgi:hypothetical protein|nr:DUF2914 domain-containing protein [Thiocapsa sp.]MCG6985767.1 DUF2914 domain-containing protein [Thiocapsa sp.]
MVDQSPRRQLRIKIGAPTSPPQPKTEYIYHWDRIIGALAALVVVVGLAGYAVYAWLAPSVPPTSVEAEEVLRGQGETLEASAQQSPVQGEEPTPPSVAAAGDSLASERIATETASDSIGSPVPSELPGTAPLPEAAGETRGTAPQRADEVPTLPPAAFERPVAQAPESAAIAASPESRSAARGDSVVAFTEEVPTLEADDLGPGDTGRLSSNEPGAESSAASASDGLPTVGAEPASDVETDGAAAVAERDQLHRPPDEPSAESTAVPVSEASSGGEAEPAPDRPPAAVTETAVDEQSDGLIRSASTSISSPAVKRFALAQAVIGNEPSGDLRDVRVNASGFAPVSSFSEVIGLEGEVLHYRWLHEGKEVLQIRVPVRAKRWRSHSTKRIYRGMKGSWRAELRDSGGTLLASIDFVF